MNMKKFKKVECVTLFTAFFYPFCGKLERYGTLIIVYLLFFVFDDHSECSWGDIARNSMLSTNIWGQMEAGLKAILASNTSISMEGWKCYAKKMFATQQEICRHYNDVQIKRFVDVWLKYVEKNKEENEKTETNYQFKDINEILEV